MKNTLILVIALLSFISVNAQNYRNNQNLYNEHQYRTTRNHDKPRINILPIIGAVITSAIIANQINDIDNYNNQREIMRQHYWRNQLELQRLDIMERQLELLEIEHNRKRGILGIFNRRSNRY